MSTETAIAVLRHTRKPPRLLGISLLRRRPRLQWADHRTCVIAAIENVENPGRMRDNGAYLGLTRRHYLSADKPRTANQLPSSLVATREFLEANAELDHLRVN